MKGNLVGLLAAALAAMLTVTACNGTGGRMPPGAASATCPARAPTVTLTGSRSVAAGTAPLVRPGPVVAAVCQYAAGLPPSKASGKPMRRIIFRGTGAAGLAAVIDSAGPVTAQARRCERAAPRPVFVQVLVFAYRAGPATSAVFANSTCPPVVVTTSGESGVLPSAAADALFYYTTVTGRGKGRPVPDLIGVSATAAQAVARRDGFSVSYDNAAIDPAVRPGTVIFQVLPPGTWNDLPSAQVEVILAVRPALACSVRQLALTYLGGESGAGNDFGTILVRDVSDRACTLAGPLRLTGLDAAGRSVTRSVRYPVSGVAVLSPDAGPVSRPERSLGGLSGVLPGELTGILPLAAEYRDAPTQDGRCNPFWVIPAAWRIILAGGGTLTVPNADRHDPARLVPSGGLVTCRGQLDLPQPVTVGWPGT